MKQHKLLTTQKILAHGTQQKCMKRELQNIIFPRWDELGLLGMMFRQCVSTKEQPDGHIYDEKAFQTVLRIISGKVLMSNRPDCYCWKLNKVATATSLRQIGTNSADALMNLCEVIGTVSDKDDKRLLAEMFANLNKDLLLVTTPPEERTCIEVTKEMYDSGITYCVDEWMNPDENGDANVTELQIGDYLIVTENGVYRIGREEFLETHHLL